MKFFRFSSVVLDNLETFLFQLLCSLIQNLKAIQKSLKLDDVSDKIKHQTSSLKDLGKCIITLGNILQLV